MEKTKKIWYFALAIIVLIVAGYLILTMPKSNQKVEKQTIKIGFIAPASGEAATYGEFVTKSFKLGLEDFNVSQNKINLEVIYEDGKCDGKQAVTALNKLINIDGVKYIIGGFCSGETLAMAPLAEANKILMLSPGSGSPDITKSGDYIFRNLASDNFTAKAIAQIAIKNGDKQIGIITENTDYPQTLKKAFSNYYTSQAGEIKADEVFNSNTTDFKTIITKFKSQEIKTIYLVTQSHKVSDLILKQMKELAYEPKIYTSEATISAEALAYYQPSYAALLENAIFTTPKFDETTAKAKKMLAEFAAKYGSTEGPLPGSYLATYYDAPSLLGEAIIKAGNTPDQVKNYFYNLKNWQGAIGNFSFDQNGDAVTDVVAKTVKNGKIAPLE